MIGQIPVGADQFLQHLLDGDFISFIISMYTTPMGEFFYGFLLLMIFAPLYAKTRSLGLCSVLWILLGSLFIFGTHIWSPFAVLLVVLGISGIFYTVYKGGT